MTEKVPRSRGIEKKLHDRMLRSLSYRLGQGEEPIVRQESIDAFGKIGSEPLEYEVIRLVSGFRLSDVLRYRGVKEDLKLKSIREANESVADHIAMNAYLVHYFLPLIEEKVANLDYQKIMDMVLIKDLPDIIHTHTMNKTKGKVERMRELEKTALYFNNLPQRNGFNIDMKNAFVQYLNVNDEENSTQEARFVKALNGLESMLYIFSRVSSVRKGMIAGNGFTLADYDNTIGSYCKEFEPLKKVYEYVVQIFKEHDYFAEESTLKTTDLTPAEEVSVIERILENAGGIKSQQPKIDTDSFIGNENDRLEKLVRSAKNRARFGYLDRQLRDHQGDTNAEHVTGLLIYNRYFLPDIQKMDAFTLAPGADFSLRSMNFRFIGHDHTEIVVGGDVVTLVKTSGDKGAEVDAATSIVNCFAPRAGGMDIEYVDKIAKFETWKDKLAGRVRSIEERLGLSHDNTGKTVLQVLEETRQVEDKLFIPSDEYAYATALDKMEASFHLYNADMVLTLNKGREITGYIYTCKQRKLFIPFPILLKHYDLLIMRHGQNVDIDSHLNDIL